MRILEEFWYGNIEPSEYDITSCKEYQKIIQQMSKSEEELRAIITDEQRKVLDRHMDNVQRFMVVTECLLFQNSFKLGARMMLEVMEEP